MASSELVGSARKHFRLASRVIARTVRRQKHCRRAMTHRIFISHATIDAPIATQVAEIIRRCDPAAHVFVASRPGDIAAGQEWPGAIQAELRAATAYVVILTPSSVSRPWVWFETGAAWMSDKLLVPVLAGGLSRGEVMRQAQGCALEKCFVLIDRLSLSCRKTGAREIQGLIVSFTLRNCVSTQAKPEKDEHPPLNGSPPSCASPTASFGLSRFLRGSTPSSS